MPKTKIKSKKHLARICRACNTTIKGNFNKHTNSVCKRKNGFKGWIFLNKDGKKVDEEQLPYRAARITDDKPGKKVSQTRLNREPDQAAWSKICRSRIMAHHRVETKERALCHHMRLVLRDKRFTVARLKQLVDEAAEKAGQDNTAYMEEEYSG